MSGSDSQGPLSSLTENSFVVLGKDSLSAFLNDDFNKNTNSDSFSENKSAYNVYESADANGDDKFQQKWWSESSTSEQKIQRKLDELLKENSQLKETLSQNNLAIKSQLDTFIMWQQEVLKTHETHKQKFLETKDLILKLRAENSSLKKHLEESSLEIPKVNSNDIYAQINKKPEHSNEIKQTVEEYKWMCNDLKIKNENLNDENHKLREELKLAKNEILKLIKELEETGRENMFLKQKNNSDYKNSLENASFKTMSNSEGIAHISNLFEQLELEKSKMLKLKNELEESKSNNSGNGSKLNTTDKLNQCIDKLNNINDSFDMQSQRYSSLSSWVSLAEQNLLESKSSGVETNLVCEIKKLKSHLGQEENMFRENQESLVELQKQFHRLLEDYKALQLKLTLLKNNDSDNEKYKEEISSLLSQLEAKDKELISKQQECDNLKETLQKLSSASEEIDLLRIQVQLNQSDFNDERAAREKLAGEKEELAEEIRHLKSRLRALEGEDFKKVDSRKSPLESPGKKTKYMCPRCTNLFSDLSTCEEHIEECLNNDFFY